MNINYDTYLKIFNSFPEVPPERGGIIGGKNETITKFVLDDKKTFTDKAMYVPDVEFINSQIEIWQSLNINFYGIIHSHKFDSNLSQEDINYIKKIMTHTPDNMKELFFPIIIPNRKIVFYKAKKLQNNVIISKENIFIKEQNK